MYLESYMISSPGSNLNICPMEIDVKESLLPIMYFMYKAWAY